MTIAKVRIRNCLLLMTLVPAYHPRFAVKVGKLDYASVATAWTNIAATFKLVSFECILPIS